MTEVNAKKNLVNKMPALFPGGRLGCAGQETAPRSLILNRSHYPKIGGSQAAYLLSILRILPGLL